MSNTETTTIITEKTRFNFEAQKVIAVIATGFVLCCTIIGVYYDFKSTLSIMKDRYEMEIKMINMRLDRLEKGEA